jgi:hypothetical protein
LHQEIHVRAPSDVVTMKYMLGFSAVLLCLLEDLGNTICAVTVYVVEDQTSIPDCSSSFLPHNIQTSPETYVATYRMGTTGALITP